MGGREREGLAEAEVHGEDGDFYGADEGEVRELDGEGDLMKPVLLEICPGVQMGEAHTLRKFTMLSSDRSSELNPTLFSLNTMTSAQYPILKI